MAHIFTPASSEAFGLEHINGQEPPTASNVKMGRADSAMTDDTDSVHKSVPQDSLEVPTSDRSPRKQRARSTRSPSLPHDTPSGSPRKHSVSSARSSSHSTKARKSREHRPRRLHTSPYYPMPRDNIEDAIAFHERSCQLMRAMSELPRYTAHDDAAGTPTSPLNLSQPEKSQFEVAAVTDTQWTSDATRRREYASIDRQNSRVRRLMRKLLPSCMSATNPAKFYDAEDESDAGSVRRYRLKLDEEKF